MKKVLIIVTGLAFAAAAFGAWTYEGQWGSHGSGNGQFDWPGRRRRRPRERQRLRRSIRLTTASNTSPPPAPTSASGARTASGNGQFNNPCGVAVAPSGNVYVADYR